MSRSSKLSAEIYVNDNGSLVPFLRIDKSGRVTWLISDERQKLYEQKLLENIGDSMSRFYSANPEYLYEQDN